MVNVLKIQTSKKKETLNLFSLLTIEAKGSNKLPPFAKLVTPLTEILVFSFSKFKILLYKFLEHLP